MTRREGQTAVTVVPLTLPTANAVVDALHRHHPPIPSGFAWWAVGAVANGELVGAAIAGRPTNRNNDDRQTVEVLRVATTGHPNACSALYGACARAARAIGSARIITYTLTQESGGSLRGSGWQREKDGITSWWTSPTTGRSPGVKRAHSSELKVRWALDLRDPVAYTNPFSDRAPVPDGQLDIFGGAA